MTLETLFPDLVRLVISYCSADDVGRLGRVSKSIRKFATDHVKQTVFLIRM